ncbi:MAG: hypothetical protein D6695_04145 [Planctomycetota bacterium]|nr:MAG: hypothetical protein D6695_04145 [Planctomycetota bacterium]
MSAPIPDPVVGSIGPESHLPHARPGPKLAALVASRLYANAQHSASTPAARDIADLASAVESQARPTHRPDNNALPFYTNPAMRNEVATSIALGRALDVKA